VDSSLMTSRAACGTQHVSELVSSRGQPRRLKMGASPEKGGGYGLGPNSPCVDRHDRYYDNSCSSSLRTGIGVRWDNGQLYSSDGRIKSPAIPFGTSVCQEGLFGRDSMPSPSTTATYRSPKAKPAPPPDGGLSDGGSLSPHGMGNPDPHRAPVAQPRGGNPARSSPSPTKGLNKAKGKKASPRGRPSNAP